MISKAHHQFDEPVSRGFSRAAGYTLVILVAALLLLALLTNPVLPH